jgi:tetratricopeptide (TPR) repeat protein
VPLALLTLGVAGIAVTPRCMAQTTYSGEKSWTDTITSPFKQGYDKLSHAFSPKPPPGPARAEDDAISLTSKAKPGPDLYTAIGRLYEQSGRLAEAEQQYQLALNENRDHLGALLGCAQLKERQGKPNDAIQLYQRAAKAHPQEASVSNNLGLCLARQSRLDESVSAMERATQLEPRNPLYRNNIAAVLVDQNRLREAYGHLRAAHGEAAAYYNLGYLLSKKGQTQAAIQHFSLALRADPSMDAARRWVQYLQKTAAQSRLAQHPTAAAVRVTTQPVMPQQEALYAPEEPAPHRLPPTTAGQLSAGSPTLPGISYEGSAAATAPLPPPSTNSALRPLPRVN